MKSLRSLHMSREKLVIQLLNLFRQYGYEGVSLAQISQVTGLGKASLYHHFPGGKEEMAQAALDYIDDWLEANILQLLGSNTTPQARLKAMLDKVGVFYDEGRKSCLWAVLTLEQSSDRFHTHIKQALTRWIDVMVEVLKETGLNEVQAKYRAEEVIIKIQGALVLARALNNTTIFTRTINEICRDVP
ncbi:TetR/AcrR family transcriptional regulator [Iningainema tapete]|nr:TetR/AcrR family transcriptional regulator [Iningainema tapete]